MKHTVLGIVAALLVAGCSQTEMGTGPSPVKETPVVAVEQPAPTTWTSCAQRDTEVAAGVAEVRRTNPAAIINFIWKLSNERMVFLQDSGVPPGYVVFDYPERWCSECGRSMKAWTCYGAFNPVSGRSTTTGPSAGES